MSISSTKTNPKLIISNYFDSLIRQIDIFTEKRLAEFELASVKTITNSDSEDNDDDKNTKLAKINVADIFRKKKTIKKRRTFTDYFDYYMNNSNGLDYYYEYSRNIWGEFESNCFDFEKNFSKNKDPKSIIVSDYLNAARDQLLDVLSQFQKETFERYDAIRKETFKDTESIMARVFEKRFVFILREKTDINELIYKNSIHLIVLDFYLNPYECQLLRYK